MATSSNWRDAILTHIRTLMSKADPEIVVEIKWRKPSNDMRGVPVWSKEGIICTGETYKAAVKMTFAKGAALPDPAKLFNASQDGGTRRAIDFHEGDEINEKALIALILEAVSLNTAAKKPARKKPKSK